MQIYILSPYRSVHITKTLSCKINFSIAVLQAIIFEVASYTNDTGASFISSIGLANIRNTTILPQYSYLPIYIPAICCQVCILLSATRTHICANAYISTYKHTYIYIQTL